MQPVEIGSTIDPEQHSFAIDNEGADPVAQGCFSDEGETVAPIVTIAGEQPHAFALAFNDHR